MQLMEELSLCRVYVKSNGLRAFDRRPSGVTINEQQPPVPPPIHNTEHHATTSTNASRPLMLERTTSLSDQSHYSSDDQTNVNHPHSMMESDDQSLLDWEELYKWF